MRQTNGSHPGPSPFQRDVGQFISTRRGGIGEIGEGTGVEKKRGTQQRRRVQPNGEGWDPTAKGVEPDNEGVEPRGEGPRGEGPKNEEPRETKMRRCEMRRRRRRRGARQGGETGRMPQTKQRR
jgi:hypothetical protein